MTGGAINVRYLTSTAGRSTRGQGPAARCARVATVATTLVIFAVANGCSLTRDRDLIAQIHNLI